MKISQFKDFDLLVKATESTRELSSIDTLKFWYDLPQTVMLVSGDNVGLVTPEYKGMCNLHWFFEARGREAINLGRRMVKYVFDNLGAEVVRGIIREDYKASRWAVRQVGLKSLGMINDPSNGYDYEIFCISKNEFKEVING